MSHIPILPPNPHGTIGANPTELMHAFQNSHRSSALTFASLLQTFQDAWKTNPITIIDAAERRAESIHEDLWEEAITMSAGYPAGKLTGPVYNSTVKHTEDNSYTVEIRDTEHPHNHGEACFIAKFHDFEEAWNFAKYATARTDA